MLGKKQRPRSGRIVGAIFAAALDPPTTRGRCPHIRAVPRNTRRSLRAVSRKLQPRPASWMSSIHPALTGVRRRCMQADKLRRGRRSHGGVHGAQGGGGQAGFGGARGRRVAGGGRTTPCPRSATTAFPTCSRAHSPRVAVDGVPGRAPIIDGDGACASERVRRTRCC